jgi:glycerophosphoryl diester phosphodiesterase
LQNIVETQIKMSKQILSSQKFLVFGHRGVKQNPAAGLYENTERSLRLAVQQGSAGIEGDAWFLWNGADRREGQVVVYHDEQYDGRTTTEWTVPSIREHDPRRQNRLDKIPLLSEYVQLFKEFPDLLFNLEFKRLEKDQNKTPLNEEDNRLIKQSLEILTQSGIQDRLIISSFDTAILEKVNKVAPEIARGLLVRREDYPQGLTSEEVIALLKRTGSIVLSPYYKLVGLTSLIPGLAKEGYSVIPWTFRRSQEAGDEPNDYFNSLLNAGINGLITDDPAYYLGRYTQLKNSSTL